MADMKLLIAEDDPNLGQILKEYLEIKGFEADLARDGEEGSQMFRDNSYDLCVLDIMMPKKDGFTLAKEIQKSANPVPFIFLTAKSLKEDTIHGLEIGADDYITKPFSMEEFLLRINAILRRTKSGQYFEDNSKISLGDSILNYDQQVLAFNDQVISLTSKECELLKLLIQHKNKVLDRKLALNLIWHDDSYFNARSMDVYIAKLRKHLKMDSSLQIITIHGQGFKLVDSK
jgi:DNA-binding response OmpR family regulator